MMRLMGKVLGLASLLLAYAAQAASGATGPTVRVVSVQPLVVVASGYAPGERLRLVARIGNGVDSRRLVATAAGTFRVTVATADTADRCTISGVVTVTRGDGTRARAFVPEKRCGTRPDGGSP
jgi:hypothetical protein